MIVVLLITILWLLCGVACFVTCWFQTRRPLTETDLFCARLDAALLAREQRLNLR